ncbi:MAG: iron ABC transporter substrate-binding protein [Acidimicrobiales bacterium]|nr:iron ABC transporter substrate-binding protein [Acidimicrobiales bacterium]MCB9371594.1 iron ABC transporter substrate-binding protein [Microthrixaceae bacterium]
MPTPTRPRRRARTRTLLATALPLPLLAVVLAACTLDGGERLTIYSGRSQNLIEPLLVEFADETGIDIDVRYGDSADLALLIDEEGDQTPADLFLSQSPGAVGFLDEQGRLSTLSESALDQVEPANRSSDGTWLGLSGRVRVLVHNTDEVDPTDLPDSVLDLVDPAFEGEVAVAPSNASFQDFVTAMRSERGDQATAEWLEGLADNGAQVYANNTAIVEAVGRGEIAYGLVNHYYNHRAREEDPSVPSENHVFPDGDIGSLLIVSAAAIPAASDRTDDAEALLSYLLQEDAQRFYAEETFEYPLARGVAAPEGLPPLDELSVDTVDLDTLGGGLARTRELIEASGLER